MRLGSDWLAERRTEDIAKLRFGDVWLTRLGFASLAGHELGDVAGYGLSSICLARLSSASRLAEVWLVGCGLEGVARLGLGLGDARLRLGRVVCLAKLGSALAGPNCA